jgi:hypothetical protein
LNFEIYDVYQEKYFITLGKLKEILNSEFGGLRKNHNDLCTNLAFVPKGARTSVDFVGCFFELIHTYIYNLLLQGEKFYVHYKNHSAVTVEESKVFLK